MISLKFLLTSCLSVMSLSLAVSQAKGCTNEQAKSSGEHQVTPVVERKSRVAENISQDSIKDVYPNATYKETDRKRILSLLNEAAQLKNKPKSWMLWFGKKFLGIPYVGGTLDAAKEEKLVINTTQLDCTTYVEMVTALARCAQLGYTRFHDFCEELRHVRYIQGEIAYEKRQHYFTVWINDNTEEGIVQDIQNNPPFTAVQHIQVNWMSTHQSDYKMLNGNGKRLKGIKALENSVNGKTYRYIPKASIVDSPLFRQTIHDGDIIAIITNKKGLDTTHIGLASWHKDGLHLLNASSIHKKVIDEPMTLRTYMMKHPSQIGIRVCRVE